jgi:hypothetical protein
MVRLNLKTWIKIFVLLAGAALAVVAFQYARTNPAGWQSQVMPGKLSAAHAQFETNCAACHTPVQGIDEAKCIGCHANNESLLQRQPTAFHANINNCAACHIEHGGANANLRGMNHEALARIGANLTPGGANIEHQTNNPLLPESHPLVSPLEARLDCASCHSTKDKHFGLFNQNCASCHATNQWTIPSFQHPSPRSQDCAQCHQAPPSHYMEHFSMVSQRVANQPNAHVSQCYACHQTTSWNDIKGLGFYKHH